METVLFVTVCAAPWAYGAVHPGFEFLLYAGVAVLLVLWALRMLVDGELTWKRCPVCLCLAGMFLLGAWQITPLGRPLLGVVSPETARLYDQLLPAENEDIPYTANSSGIANDAGKTISLYPGATRLAMLRILAVFLVFAVVRNNLATPQHFQRLAIAALINGALLSVFALLQFFSSPHDTLYWTYPSMGQVFGPFICKNHFPFYVNMCLGLGLGLFWGTGRLIPSLRDPVSLWICLALSLMLSAVLMSLSRGAVLALVGAFATCLLVRTAGSYRHVPILVSTALAIGLLSWLGLQKIEARLSTFWRGNALQESRLELWSCALPIAKDFPIWGTGYGTYQYVDPMYRSDKTFTGYIVDYVHNDYLEVLDESGLVGLLLSGLAIFLVFRFGIRAARQKQRSGGLALGGLFALVTVAVHSAGDFGLHIPAIALLTSVVCAHLCALGDRPKQMASAVEQNLTDRQEAVFRSRGVAPFLGALMCVTFGLMLLHGGWTRHAADSLRFKASQAEQASLPGANQRRKDLLELGVKACPVDAELRLDCARALADVFREEQRKFALLGSGLDAGAIVLLMPSTFARGSGPLGVCADLMSLRMVASVRRARRVDQETQLASQYLTPAIEHLRIARDQCPFLPEAHWELASFAGRLVHGDAAPAYERRMQVLAPFDPILWYRCGRRELNRGEFERAWQSWRRSLELSNQLLTPILNATAKKLGPDGLVRHLLPEQPQLLLDVALRLYPTDLESRKPLLNEALVLLTTSSKPSADALHTQALVHKSLGQGAQAKAILQSLLVSAPRQWAWRLDLARILQEEGNLREAWKELLTVSGQAPTDPQTKELFATVTEQLLKDGRPR
jgi:O-antigen ligase/tetratricopeptide (TPR) repeat protein